MDDDDLPRPGSPMALIQSENLDPYSLDMLEQRIRRLELEILRSRELIARKQASRSAADSFFNTKKN